MRQACTLRIGHGRSTGKPVYGRRVRGSRMTFCAPFRPPFGRRNGSGFWVLARVLQGYFGICAGGLVATIIQHSQVGTVFFEHHDFFPVLVRIQVGPLISGR
jgi:hypothetical protein